MKIQIENLKKSFGEKVAVDIEQYEIRDGEMLGLVGNNGAGKSTLFRLMLDLVKADGGRVLMHPSEEEQSQGIAQGSVDVAQTEDWKDWTGAFVDESFLIDYLTPDEYFQFIGRISGRKQEDVDTGDVAVVLVNGDSATVKRIKKETSGITLIPNNPAYDPKYYSNEDIQRLPVKIIGKVLELRGKF